jgi:CBS domain-containing protein
MAVIRTDETEGRTVAEVMHDEVAPWPRTATVGEVRAWFAASASRRLALLADGDRYLGALTPAEVADGIDGDRFATELASEHPTVAPDAPASAGLELVLASAARRVPVVDREGRLVGVLAITTDRQAFACRSGVEPGAA